MPEVKIVDLRKVNDGKFSLNEINFEVQKQDGSWEKQVRQVFDHGNAVTVLLYNKEKRTIILTKQFRLATYINGNPTGMLLEACAGLLEAAEDPDEAVKREIEEETGYVVDTIQKVHEGYSSAGSLTELLLLYIAEYNHSQKKSKGGGLEEEGEHIEVIEMPFDEAFAMLENGQIKDIKTIILLQHMRLKQLL